MTLPQRTLSHPRGSDFFREFLELLAPSRDRVLGFGLDSSGGEINPLQQRQLALIAEAIDRLRRGAFGICVRCEGKIPLERLRKSPCAKTCVGCQESVEQARPGQRRYLKLISDAPTESG